MTPSEIAQLSQQIAIPGTVREWRDRLSFDAFLHDREVRSRWLTLQARRPGFIDEVIIAIKGSDAPVDDQTDLDDRTPVAVTVTKISVEKELRLFFGSTLSDVAEHLKTTDHVLVADMDASRASFTSYRSRFQTWTEEASAVFAPSELLPDPRRTTNDFTARNTVPNDIRPWLLQRGPDLETNAFLVWKHLASRKLLAATADQVSLLDEQPQYHFSGPPSCKFVISDDGALSLFSRLTDGSVWTFASGGRDTDTRHLLLAAEWSRSHASDVLDRLGVGSLESAQAAYNAYVKAGSKDTLKALADLRKAVSEDTQKATQRAQDMTGAMWKDIAVASIPFVIKVLSDAQKTPNLWIAVGFAAAAAAFLFISLRIQTRLNARSFATQKEFRQLWKSKLNQVLSNQEIEEFTDKPVLESIGDYEHVRDIISAIYTVLISVLLIFAAYEFREATLSTLAASTPAQTSTMSLPIKH